MDNHNELPTRRIVTIKHTSSHVKDEFIRYDRDKDDLFLRFNLAKINMRLGMLEVRYRKK